MSWKIESVYESALPEIVDLNSRIFAGMYENPPYSLQQYQDKVRDVDPLILVARDKSTLVSDSISFERDHGWYIWILGVDPLRRNQGIASQLLELNETYARANNLGRVDVKVYNVSPNMQRLLLARNYLVTGIEPSQNNPKYNALHFSLDLLNS